ncbi:winged helix-turn-helix transcriptional regulator [Sinosporangium siamense]|uniref:winged helix-turn-helix transcriptional regulator n=1 Tax=Sinosporangium siamense TaxID=1367973 RepID=UPI0035EEFC2B
MRGVEIAMEVLGGRWKLAVLEKLLESGTLRFGELKRVLPGVTQRMLTRQLRELETDGLVERTVYRQVPPKVEYSLTEAGESLRDIAARLGSWGRWYLDTHGTPSGKAAESGLVGRDEKSFGEGVDGVEHDAGEVNGADREHIGAQ